MQVHRITITSLERDKQSDWPIRQRILWAGNNLRHSFWDLQYQEQKSEFSVSILKMDNRYKFLISRRMRKLYINYLVAAKNVTTEYHCLIMFRSQSQRTNLILILSLVGNKLRKTSLTLLVVRETRQFKLKMIMLWHSKKLRFELLKKPIVHRIALLFEWSDRHCKMQKLIEMQRT